MDAKLLYQKCCDADVAGNPALVDSALKEYKTARCYHPVKVKVFDSHLGKFVMRSVPCGHCYHCRQTRVNEWVTRLYAHADYYKYIYFVTLTYRSFDLEMNDYDKFMFDYLRDCLFVKDDLNQNHKLCYNPSFFPKKHYQDFLKRLRKNTGIEGITYFGCAEYGHKFARPHYHFIIFSPEPIKYIDIERAWSLQLTKSIDNKVYIVKNSSNRIQYNFGRVEIVDLVENGTIAKQVNVDGKNMNGKACFAYVAKYIGKNEFNTKRIAKIYETFKDSLSDFDRIFSVTPTTFKEFVSLFRPYLICSRGTPIGSLFVADHIREMANGVFARPALQVQRGYVVPSYFRKKAAESIFGLRVVSTNHCIGKGNLPSLASALSCVLKKDIPSIISSITDKNANALNLPYKNVEYISGNEKALLKSPDCFVDVFRKSRFLITYEFIGQLPDVFVTEYKYYIKQGWLPIAYHSLSSWCSYYLSCMPKDFTNYLNQLNKTLENDRYLELVEGFYTSSGRDDVYNSMIKSIEKDNDSYLKMKNVSRYHSSNL